jgi:flagellar hook-basal body complex protein FliE
MDPVASRAIAGYAQGAAAAPARSQAAPEGQQSQDFASFFRSLAEQSVSTLQAGEQASIQGLEGKLDAQSVVEAVAAAELTLQTVTAVRDRVVEAYQELIRMPI